MNHTTRFRANKMVPTRGKMRLLVLVGVLTAVTTTGCQGGRFTLWEPFSRRGGEKPVQQVFSLYDQKPWLNLDIAGDRDPEGFRFRVFLDDGKGKGVLRDGTFHIAMYGIRRTGPTQIERTLVSDWDYPTSNFSRIKSKLLGFGYLLRLRWASKDIAGMEVEVVTRFEDTDGNIVSAATKRLRVPKYTS